MNDEEGSVDIVLFEGETTEVSEDDPRTAVGHAQALVQALGHRAGPWRLTGQGAAWTECLACGATALVVAGSTAGIGNATTNVCKDLPMVSRQEALSDVYHWAVVFMEAYALTEQARGAPPGQSIHQHRSVCLRKLGLAVATALRKGA